MDNRNGYFIDVLTSIKNSDKITSTGIAAGHFGEVLQGIFAQDHGLVRGLVTMPCAKAITRSTITIRRGEGKVVVPDGKEKTKRAVLAYLRDRGIPPDIDVGVTLSGNVPIGIGMGSSTSDIVATLRALDRAFGYDSAAADIARLAVSAEMASDSIMVDDGIVLFAQRSGRIIRRLGDRLPPLTILGVDLMPGEVFLTTEVPPCDYCDAEIEEFGRLLDRLERALADQSAQSVSDVATASALINESYHPKKNFGLLREIQKQSGALGVMVSHSGTIAGLMFQKTEREPAESFLSAKAAIEESGMKISTIFEIE